MSKKKLGCDYYGNEFGAHYLDSTCIDGYLWDMDSGGIDELSGANYYDHGGGISLVLNVTLKNTSSLTWLTI